MDKRKFRLAVVTPVVTALVVVTVVLYLILQGAASGGAHQGVAYSPEMGAVTDPADTAMAQNAQEEAQADALPVMGEAACNYQDWVGKTVDEQSIKATGRPYRILGLNAAATMDFNPERINIIVDDKNIVMVVRCG